MSSQPDLPPNSAAVPVDAAANMIPLPQPTGPTPTQKVIEDLPGFKMYKELAVVEV